MNPIDIEKHTITALVEDRAGVLNRISSMFRRRGYNISSLAVGKSEAEGLSRMTFVVEGPEEVVRLVAAKLDRLIEVVEVEDISDLDHVYREMVLIKVTADNEKRGEILQLSNIFNVKENIINVFTGDVGGGFGMKIFNYPEYVLTLAAAKLT